MGILRTNELWALSSLQTLPMAGPKGPAKFISALSSSFDNGTWANYVSWRLRFPEGPYLSVALDRLNASRFPAANDAERLYRIGNTFQLKQYEFESGANFELRCGLAWDLHEDGGTSIAVRKGLEAYGFPQVAILEEHIEPEYYVLTSSAADFQWAHAEVFGPNYGDLPIEGLFLGTWVLGSPASYLGLGTFSSERIDDVLRVMLEWRQVHDCPLRMIFRFGNAPLLGLLTLPFTLGGGTGDGAAYREILGRRMLGQFILGQTTTLGFGI
jgi:hypothetical protein